MGHTPHLVPPFPLYDNSRRQGGGDNFPLKGEEDLRYTEPHVLGHTVSDSAQFLSHGLHISSSF